MCVDDDEMVLKVLRARLEGAGFEVVTKTDPFGLLMTIEEKKPVLVMLDLQMPVLSGGSVAKLVKSWQGFGSIPILFHSSQPLMELQQTAADVGALGAISKTANHAKFLSQFERFFARIRPAEKT